MDHLTESADYYDKLQMIEQQSNKKRRPTNYATTAYANLAKTDCYNYDSDDDNDQDGEDGDISNLSESILRIIKQEVYAQKETYIMARFENSDLNIGTSQNSIEWEEYRKEILNKFGYDIDDFSQTLNGGLADCC